MRIAIVAGGYPSPERPQSGIFTQRTARALASRADVHVVQLRSWRPGRRRSERVVVDGVPVLRLCAPQLPLRGGELPNLLAFRFLALFRGLADDLRRSDVIHSVGLTAGVIASAWSEATGTPHVLQVNASVRDDVVAALCRIPGVARFDRGLHGVVATSRQTRDEFAQRFPRVPNVSHAYRGVDLEAFSAEGALAGPLVDRPSPRFLFAGGFPEYTSTPFGRNTKGGETLLAAWRAAEDELARAGATLLLAGPLADTPAVRAEVQALRDPGRVLVLGAIPPKEMAAYLRAADIVVHPSLSEGLPNLVVEAAACGRAVLASDAGGTAEVIVDGETGWVVAAGDVRALSAALVRVAGAPDRSAEAGRRARLRAASHFDSRAYPAALLAAYERAIALSAAGRG